jgi:hypothetical protein
MTTDSTVTLVERVGRLVGRVDSLEQQLAYERARVERQRAADARQLEEQAAQTRDAKTAELLRSLAKEMRARGVVR